VTVGTASQCFTHQLLFNAHDLQPSQIIPQRSGHQQWFHSFIHVQRPLARLQPRSLSVLISLQYLIQCEIGINAACSLWSEYLRRNSGLHVLSHPAHYRHAPSFPGLHPLNFASDIYRRKPVSIFQGIRWAQTFLTSVTFFTLLALIPRSPACFALMEASFINLRSRVSTISCVCIARIRRVSTEPRTFVKKAHSRGKSAKYDQLLQGGTRREILPEHPRSC